MKVIVSWYDNESAVFLEILQIDLFWKILDELPSNLSKTTWQCHQLARYDANRGRTAR